MKTYLVTDRARVIGSNLILYMLNKYEYIKIFNLNKLTIMSVEEKRWI